MIALITLKTVFDKCIVENCVIDIRIPEKNTEHGSD